MSRDGIILDEERGINPRLTVCPRCGEENHELALIGNQDYVYECLDCHGQFLAPKGKSVCTLCKKRNVKRLRRLEEMEKIVGNLCDACKKREQECEEEVKAGGVFWRCTACGSSGAVKRDHPLAKEVRDQLKVAPPDPAGVEFNKEDCPVCRRRED